jgi:hypothetical protein
LPLVIAATRPAWSATLTEQAWATATVPLGQVEAHAMAALWE